MARYPHYATGKVLEYLEAKSKHSYFTFWFSGNSFAPITNKYFTLVQLSCVALWAKRQVAMAEIQDARWTVYDFFYTSPQISPNFRVIHPYVIGNLKNAVAIQYFLQASKWPFSCEEASSMKHVNNIYLYIYYIYIYLYIYKYILSWIYYIYMKFTVTDGLSKIKQSWDFTAEGN